eukprot:m.93197 g.93197  ORF g.93197 m.93197 type:complete len:159 (-) comp12116_c0_seq4:156-632(-)
MWASWVIIRQQHPFPQTHLSSSPPRHIDTMSNPSTTITCHHFALTPANKENVSMDFGMCPPSFIVAGRDRRKSSDRSDRAARTPGYDSSPLAPLNGRRQNLLQFRRNAEVLPSEGPRPRASCIDAEAPARKSRAVVGGRWASPRATFAFGNALNSRNM